MDSEISPYASIKMHIPELSEIIYIKKTLFPAIDLRKLALYVVAILIFVNGITGSSVIDNTINTLTSEEKANFRSEFTAS